MKILFLLLLLIPSVAYSNTIENNLKSIVVIRSIDKEGKGGLGSGFFINGDGYLVTNNHVIENSKQMSAMDINGSIFEVELVSTDKLADLALLKTKTYVNATHVDFYEKNDIKYGETVYAIGSPLGLAYTLTYGVVSNPKRYGVSTFYSVIQTDASINKGNSGGPLFNKEGKVIGINASIASREHSGSIGLGFAIPATYLLKNLDYYINKQEIKRSKFSINAEQNYREQNGIQIENGIKVAKIAMTGAAAIAGLKQNDIIEEINGVKITNMARFIEHVTSLDTEIEHVLKIKRNDDYMIIKIKPDVWN